MKKITEWKNTLYETNLRKIELASQRTAFDSLRFSRNSYIPTGTFRGCASRRGARWYYRARVISVNLNLIFIVPAGPFVVRNKSRDLVWRNKRYYAWDNINDRAICRKYCLARVPLRAGLARGVPALVISGSRLSDSTIVTRCIWITTCHIRPNRNIAYHVPTKLRLIIRRLCQNVTYAEHVAYLDYLHCY